MPRSGRVGYECGETAWYTGAFLLMETGNRPVCREGEAFTENWHPADAARTTT